MTLSKFALPTAALAADGVSLVDTKITPISITFQAVDQYFEIPTSSSYTERTKEEARELLEILMTKE